MAGPQNRLKGLLPQRLGIKDHHGDTSQMPFMRHATRANLARSMLFMGSLAVPAASVSAAEPARWPANVAAIYRLCFNVSGVCKYQFQ